MIIHLVSGEAFNIKKYKYLQTVDKHGDVSFYRIKEELSMDNLDIHFALRKAILFGHLVELGNDDEQVSVSINASNISYISN